MTELYFFFLYFFVYGFLGWCTEVAFAAWKEHRFVNRGFLNGPICPIYGIGVSLVVQFLSPYKDNLILLYITSIILVTTLEWLTGFVLEKIFHNKWWDYSNMPLNLNGYVCLLFSLMWGIACVLIVDFIHPVFHAILAHIPFPLGITLIIVLGIVLFADLYVTASGILKLNKRLERMHEIADELHQISDKLGENIYENTIIALEKQNELKESMTEKQKELKKTIEEQQEDFKNSIAAQHENLSETINSVSEEVKERIIFLRSLYREIGENTPKLQKRLMRAFPKMESRNHEEVFDDLRSKLKSLDKPFHKNH